MQNKIYSVLTQFEAKPGKEVMLEASLNALIPLTLKEEGCIAYRLHKCQNNPAIFLFYENWSSSETFQNHINSTHVQDWLKDKDTLLAKPYEISFWEASN